MMLEKLFGRVLRNADAGGSAGGASGSPAAAGGAPAGGSAGSPAGSAPASTWIDKMEDASLREFAVNKGYNKASVEEVAPSIVQQYRNLEVLMGAEKAGKTVVIPDFEKGDDTALGSFYDRIGRPKEGKDYDLALPKDGVNAEFEAWARTNFHKNGLTAKQANAVSKSWTEFTMAQVARENADKMTKSAAEDKGLKQSWGAAYDDKMSKSRAVAKTFGLSVEELDAMQNVAGYGKTMQFFANIADKMGEDTFVGGERTESGPMTPAEAQAALKAHQNDKDWMAAWLDKRHPKHKEVMERKEFLSNMIAAGKAA